MKKLFYLATVALLCCVACNQGEDPSLTAAKRANDSLQAIVDSKNGEISALFDMLNQIEENMNEVTAKYGVMQQKHSSDPEGNYIAKSEINEQIASIDKLLAANKKKIADLNATIKAMGSDAGSLKEFVAKLEQRCSEQEELIAQLQFEIENNKAEIRSLNESVSTLTAQNEEKDRTIARHIAEANKVYYIVGSYESLKESGVVSKSGGFIGIGRKQGVVSNLPTRLFKEIDCTATTSIQVNLRNAVVVSSHPESSYELVKSDVDEHVTSYIRILNPKLFWQNTKYLIISTKK